MNRDATSGSGIGGSGSTSAATWRAGVSSTPLEVEVRRRKLIAGWLFTMCGMVFFMVMLGGVTRLTNSGLSMADWRPVTGWLPPLNDTEWQQTFSLYQQTPEFREKNLDMTVDEFRGIFWLEYLHRLWGRIIGIAFFVPFALFWVRGWLDREMKLKCLGLFVLGGLQGVLGWYMVKSGLVDEPAVSQYRLAAHLGLALVIYLAIFWVALGLTAPRLGHWREGRRFAGKAGVLLAAVFLTVMSGAFVAGLDAGLIYNTFPLMHGAFVPADYLELSPAYLNVFENIAAVQFNHRWLAVSVFIAILSFWLWARRQELSGGAAKALRLVPLAATAQVCLGIATLVFVVPVPLAALHQAGAVVLLTTVLWFLHECRR